MLQLYWNFTVDRFHQRRDCTVANLSPQIAKLHDDVVTKADRVDRITKRELAQARAQLVYTYKPYDQIAVTSFKQTSLFIALAVTDKKPKVLA